MKKWLSTLLLVVLLAQALPVSAMASVGRVLSDAELDRAYALTGLGKGDGLYHNGMSPNESMNGMQLVGWLEERLDERLHNIDDVFPGPGTAWRSWRSNTRPSMRCSPKAPSMKRRGRWRCRRSSCARI